MRRPAIASPSSAKNGWVELEHSRQREVAQLEHVAEQDEPVGGGDLLEQGGADRRVADEVLAGAAAEVQVGDDRGAHAAQTSGATLCVHATTSVALSLAVQPVSG